jgi:gas vesicle protein
MTTSNDPDEIRAEIERTRANLSNDVNTLTDTVTPSHVARRQVDKARGAVAGVKDKVMGSAGDLQSSASDKASGVAGKASDSYGAVSGAVTGAPQTVKSRAAGNPLAAGLIAVGVGWLIGSLMPVSEREKQAATQVKDTAMPVVSDAAKEVAENLKPAAQDAVESVKETAADAATTVKEEGKSSAQDVQGQAADAKDTIQESRS